MSTDWPSRRVMLVLKSRVRIVGVSDSAAAGGPGLAERLWLMVQVHQPVGLDDGGDVRG